MKPERIEQEALYDNRSPKSAKRLALSALLLEENIDTKVISRVVGVSERQIRNHRSVYKKQGVFALTNNTRYKPVSELKAYEGIIPRRICFHPLLRLQQKLPKE